MSVRAKLIGGVVLAAVALATWKFMTPRVELSFVGTPQADPGPATATPPPVKIHKAAAAPDPVPPMQEPPLQSNLTASQHAERRDDPNALTEQTLVGTKWEREGFGLEFGAAGKLLICGRERANWRVEGQRVRLYRDTTGEEHWLDIVGNKLMWEGQEIGRVP
jgi:hypothetical protein